MKPVVPGKSSEDSHPIMYLIGSFIGYSIGGMVLLILTGWLIGALVRLAVGSFLVGWGFIETIRGWLS